MDKIYNQKNFKYFVWTLLDSRIHTKYNFSSSLHEGVSNLKFALFWWIGDLPPVSMTQVANLPLVSLVILLYLVSCCSWRFYCCWRFCCCWHPFSSCCFYCFWCPICCWHTLIYSSWQLASLLFLALNAVVSVLMLLRSCCCWHPFWSWCFYVVGVSSVVATYCCWLFCSCSLLHHQCHWHEWQIEKLYCLDIFG